MISPTWENLRCALLGTPGNLRPLSPLSPLGDSYVWEPGRGVGAGRMLPASQPWLTCRKCGSRHHPGKQRVGWGEYSLACQHYLRDVTAWPTFGKDQGTFRKKVLLFPTPPQTSSKAAAESVNVTRGHGFQGTSKLSVSPRLPG